MTARMGWFAWRVDRIPVKSIDKELEDFTETIEINSTRCQYIGVIASVLGIGLAFQSFGGGENKIELLAKVGTCIYNIVISMGAYILLNIMCRHIVVNVKKILK